MGSLVLFWCLAVAVWSAAARPSAEVSLRDGRGQTIMDGSDPFWVFHTAEKPIMYIPKYDAVIVPSEDVQTHALPAIQGLANILPFQPPRRRRPILAVLDLLQKRYNLQLGSTDDTDNPIPSGIESIVSVPSKDSSNSTSTTEVTKPNASETTNSGNGKTNHTLDSKEMSKSQMHHLRKVPQIPHIYSLVDEMLKEHPDMKDGYSYAFKYRVPQVPSKLEEVEVSVQQSINRLPQITEDLFQNRVFKTPIDYRKAQAKLDSLLEESTKSGGPIHLNTPGAFGPFLLSQHLEKIPEEKTDSDSVVVEVQEGDQQKPTKLMLRPVAKAVAGPRGVAVASPIAKAMLKRGQRVTVEFEPDAVAIAGPGGRAHSHPEFSVDYIDTE